MTSHHHGRLISAILILFLCTHSSRSQQSDARASHWERAYDVLLERSDEGDCSDLAEMLERAVEQPLCLHSSTLGELEELPFLTPVSARALHALLQADSAIGWSDIRALPQLSRDDYALLRVCATLQCPRRAVLPTHTSYRLRVQQEDEPRAGFLDGSYPGGRARVMQRIEVQRWEHVRVALLQERDPGEKDFADHLSGHIALEHLGAVRRAVLGDFHVTAGQGLVFWQPFGFSKGGDALTVAKRGAMELRPSASATEGLFFRGAAMQLSSGEFRLLGFGSSSALDAGLDEETGTVGSFSADGMHRGASEAARKAAVRERIFGGGLAWRREREHWLLDLGITGWHGSYSQVSEPRTPFGFRGDRAWASGVNLNAAWGDAQLFGELALCHTRHSAMLLGARARLSERIDAVLLYRRYNARFINIHGLGFGERGGELQNEEGVYAGVRLRAGREWRIDAWTDVFRLPNRTYFLHLPTSGGEFLLHAQWQRDDGLHASLRFAHGQKDMTIAAVDVLGRDIRPLARRAAGSVRLQMGCEPGDGVRLRLRLDRSYTRYDAWGNDDDGMLLAASCRLRLRHNLSCTFSVSSTATGAYDARLYEFEHDVPGVFQNVAVYGDTWRCAVLCEWHAADWLRAAVRYGVQLREGSTAIGEGRDRVLGDRLGRVSAQIDLRY